MKKSIILPVLLLCFLLAGCEEEGETYSIDKVDVHTQVLPDGDLYVEELLTYTFQGAFHRAKRSIEPGEREGIEFFEAYVPPKGKELGQFSYQGLPSLKAEWNSDEHTFYVDFPSKDETRQLYYRYRVDQAASRYVRAGELVWKFFDNNLTDLHHVTMDIVLPKPVLDHNVHAFLHDRTGGRVTKSAGSTIRYENEKLSQYGNAEIRIVFPPEYLSEAPTKSKAVRVEQILEEEQQREKQLSLRETRLRLAEKVLIGLIVLFAAVILCCRFPWRVVRAWLSRKEKTFEELEQTNPVLISYVYRKGRWRWGDYLAGVFSMHQHGFVRVVEASVDNRFPGELSAPKTVLRFVLKGDRALLNDADLYLANWLFRRSKQGGGSFRMDSIAGATPSERKQGKRIQYYRNIVLRFRDHFHKWKDIVGELEPYKSYIQHNRWMKPLFRGLALIHWIVIVFMYYADAVSRAGFWTAFGLVGAFAAVAAYYYQRKLVMAAYFICCFFVAAQIVDEAVITAYFGLSLVSLLLVAAVPRSIMSAEAAQYRFTIQAWRRKLKQGADFAETDENRLERLAEYAIILDAGIPYVRRIQKRLEREGKSFNSPLLQLPIVSSILFIHQTLFNIPAVADSSSSSSSSDGSYADAGDSGGGDGGGTGAD